MKKARTGLRVGIAAALLVVGFSAIATTVSNQPIGAVLIAPFTVTPVVGTSLNFGTVSYSTSATTTVDLDPVTGTASSTDGAGVVSASGAMAAQFDIASGQAGASYTVNFTTTLPLDISASGGAPANSVRITALTWAGTGGLNVGTLDGLGADTLSVGGTLEMTNAAVASPAYSGQYNMDVVYN